jgi:Tfp pilus assembly protein PilX
VSGPLCFALFALIVVSVLGIVAIDSILQHPRHEANSRSLLDPEANAADERYDLMPGERESP